MQISWISKGYILVVATKFPGVIQYEGIVDQFSLSSASHVVTALGETRVKTNLLSEGYRLL
jgi:hypothetical protein